MKGEIYPSYFQLEDGSIVAIVASDKMYIVRSGGRNKNPGVVLDHFITRKQVLSYYGRGARITCYEFRTLYGRLYFAYLDRMAPLKYTAKGDVDYDS